MELEFDCINIFMNIDIIKNNFTIKRCFDGCKNDIIIKPVSKEEDEWLGIQVKTTLNPKGKKYKSYKFHLDKDYTDSLILCICKNANKMWLIPYNNVKNLTSISIGLNKSKYDIYEIDEKNIINKIFNFYKINNKFNCELLNLPKSKNQLQEYEFSKIRKNKLSFITFNEDRMEGSVYDFIINGKKFQEKVGTISRKNLLSHRFGLYKYGPNKTKINYQLGDNDFYWLNCKNNSFYIIPENILYNFGYIGPNENLKQFLGISNTNNKNFWANEYLFNYENIDKEKILKLI